MQAISRGTEGNNNDPTREAAMGRHPAGKGLEADDPGPVEFEPIQNYGREPAEGFEVGRSGYWTLGIAAVVTIGVILFMAFKGL